MGTQGGILPRVCLNAKSFNDFYKAFIPGYGQLMSNVGNFKKIVTKIYAIRRNRECLAKMNSKEQGYRKVEYNARYNQDRLYRMRISHDTLLEYSEKMVVQYPGLQQIIIDKYPYIFIDEYQDTAEEVVKIMAVLENRGKEIEHTAFIGYYGDSVQSIYDYGIGERILEKHLGLKKVYKQFNRRSYEEIIAVANKIRLDGLQQESIFADCKGGKVEYCVGHSFDAVLEKCRNEWKNEADKKIHCFLLKNEEVAEKTGISDIYNVFKGAKAYSGSNYKQLNTELLSNDREKLGRAAAFLYRILKLYTDIQEDETPVEEILYGDITKYINLDIQKLKDIKQQLMGIKGDTLGDIINKMCECYVHGDVDVKMIIEAVLDTEKVTYPYIIAFLVQALDSNRVQDERTEANIEDMDLDRVKQLLAINIKEFEKWFYYVERKEQEEIVYHTYHGTKGLEFENVLIVIEDGFGTSVEDRVFIKKFLEDYVSLDEKIPIGDYEKARNLLYVVVTRAIKNLKVVYEGESGIVEETLARIFNEQTATTT
ncbi:MAG: UvrD-helicase domain-containing protein [Blautia sp.]|nr:UvrD-helicase domain-containing protein [Blautia sp.]